MAFAISINPLITMLVIAQTLAIVVLVLLLIRRQRIEQSTTLALQDWYVKQSSLLEHQADTIRDSSLQELFALRRSLELSELKPTQTEPKQYQRWVQQLGVLYASLSGLVETLSPPLTDGNLPVVALSHLKQVIPADQSFTVETGQCANWGRDTVSTNKLLLAFLQGLVEQGIAHQSASSIALDFGRKGYIKYLDIKLGTSGRIAPDYQDYIFESCRVVKVLGGIEYDVTPAEKVLRIQLQWQGDSNI